MSRTTKPTCMGWAYRDPDNALVNFHGMNIVILILSSDFIYNCAGTWTPLHADVFRSYSWSANVCGKKKWHFLSPSQCHLLFDM